MKFQEAVKVMEQRKKVGVKNGDIYRIENGIIEYYSNYEGKWVKTSSSLSSFFDREFELVEAEENKPLSDEIIDMEDVTEIPKGSATKWIPVKKVKEANKKFMDCLFPNTTEPAMPITVSRNYVEQKAKEIYGEDLI